MCSLATWCFCLGFLPMSVAPWSAISVWWWCWGSLQYYICDSLGYCRSWPSVHVLAYLYHLLVDFHWEFWAQNTDNIAAADASSFAMIFALCGLLTKNGIVRIKLSPTKVSSKPKASRTSMMSLSNFRCSRHTIFWYHLYWRAVLKSTTALSKCCMDPTGSKIPPWSEAHPKHSAIESGLWGLSSRLRLM